jgi:hypothetical protein
MMDEDKHNANGKLMNKIITQRAETVYGLLQEQLEFV